MAEKVAFELVSPERLLLSREVDMVVVPGAEGDFGVLPGHAPFATTLRPGVIDVYDGDRIDERVFVAGGFAEVTPERCTVLAEEATALGELERKAVEASLKDLRDEVSEAKDDAERQAAERALGVAEAKLAALDLAPPTKGAAKG